MESRIEITLFGKFEIKMDHKPILENLSNTRKTKLFLSYLLLHKQKAVSHKELFELLWSGEDYANPGTALRTLLYRYRALIEKAGITQLQNSIISRRSAYQWNQELDVSIDIFDFEDYSKIGLNKAMSREKRKQCLLKAISLYTGGLLPDSGSEHWVVPRAVYYRDLYLKDVIAYIEELKQEKAFDDIIALCSRATALTGANDLIILEQKLAEQKGHPDVSVVSRYEKTKKYIGNMEDVIGTIQDNMETDDADNIAFVCDYSVFRDIYHLQRRLLARTGDTMFLTLLTMGKSSGGEFDDLQNEKIMKAIMDCCCHELRCGDSICRYSDNQHAIMFPADSFENAIKIMERVKSAFMSEANDHDVLLTYHIRPLKNAKE